MNPSLDDTVENGLERLRSFRQQIEEDHRNGRASQHPRVPRHRRNRRTSTHDRDESWDRYAHTPHDPTYNRQRMRSRSRSTQSKTPSKERPDENQADGSKSDQVSFSSNKWADNSAMSTESSSFDSTHNTGRKRKRRRNRRGGRGKNTRIASPEDIQNALDNLEESTGRLEGKRNDLQSVVDTVRTAVKEVSPPNPSPGNLSWSKTAIYEQTDETLMPPPPAYDSLCIGKPLATFASLSDMLREKNFLPTNFVIYPLEENAGTSGQTNQEGTPGEENPTTVDRISKILNEGMSGPFGALDANTSTVSEVDLEFEYQTNKHLPGKHTYHELNDETVEVEIDDLMPEKYRGERGQDKKVKIKGVVQFVVVRTGRQWLEFLPQRRLRKTDEQA